MRKTISTYWPIAMLVPLAVAGYCHTIHPAASGSGNPLTHAQSAANVSAEFARGLSMGLVETDSVPQGYGHVNQMAAPGSSQAL